MATAIGIIGGSGLYEIDGFEKAEERAIATPFGDPSDVLVGGTLGGREVWFLPRHGRGHRLLPTEINHRANLWALRSVGVRHLICVTAVGSLKEEYHPRDIVLPDQYFDRTSRRELHTFFGGGIVGHVSFADPVSAGMRGILKEAATAEGAKVHDRGTYVNMDGPAFSTRAESETNRKLGFDIIGMTNLPEAKLARESEIALATLAMITDYDCWKVEEEPVTAEAVMGHLHANVSMAKRIIARAIALIPAEAEWPEHRSLDGAIMTPRHLWPAEKVESLRPMLQRFL
ncbi:S-methyl-5'-thioadenosine phosphorylase [Luteolibacter flavescens]|uniref:S-methyl-5'-thioadenosine phosphorylase n=1 Tax=Luteolibacter flavescens TaxID=1859460 RepID=A0ABT3FQB2_9BACT|nr:S-methyl-5'-thioadenosine phosphorylase [Luteolibacter flavescens]MCW1885781.1 S-methyl-5'-thioadenosine phosphorylase [Luteolibacter flavescens]